MLDIVQRATFGRMKTRRFPEFKTGDTVGVYVKVKEGEKERVQLYTGVVIRIQGKGMSRSFTVRKIASGVGVERTFPYMSPALDRVELIATGQVRRGRLYYLRNLKGRAARLTSTIYQGEGVGAADELPEAQAAATDAPVDEAAESKEKAKN